MGEVPMHSAAIIYHYSHTCPLCSIPTNRTPLQVHGTRFFLKSLPSTSLKRSLLRSSSHSTPSRPPYLLLSHASTALDVSTPCSTEAALRSDVSVRPRHGLRIHHSQLPRVSFGFGAGNRPAAMPRVHMWIC